MAGQEAERKKQMKIRTGFVSNSSSSSFTCFIEANYFEQFLKDFEEFQTMLHKLFPKFENEWFTITEKKRGSIREQVIDYIKENEDVKHPSEDLIEFFTEKLKKNGYFNKQDNHVEIEYDVDTEDRATIGFQYLCAEFIQNYRCLKNKIENADL